MRHPGHNCRGIIVIHFLKFAPSDAASLQSIHSGLASQKRLWVRLTFGWQVEMRSESLDEFGGLSHVVTILGAFAVSSRPVNDADDHEL